MITEQQWLEDRHYVSQLRYGLDRYNRSYADKIPYLNRTYNYRWWNLPYDSTISIVNEHVNDPKNDYDKYEHYKNRKPL